MEQTLFDKNIAFLDKKFAGLGSMIIEKSKEVQEEIELETGVSVDGQLLIKVLCEDKSWYLNGRRNALEPVKSWVEYMEKISRGATISLIGMGNGSYLEQMVEIAEENVKFIVYEPSIKIVLEALKNIDIKELSKRSLIVLVVEGVNAERLEDMYDNIFEFALLEKACYFTHPNYKNIFPEKVLEATKLLRKVLYEKLVAYNTNIGFSDVVIQNLFHNMRHIPDAYKTSQFAGKIPYGVPAIVVAAGPSLNKNIEDLKLAKDKALIVAVDTAIKPLLKAGIVPDMLFIVDGKKPVELFKVEGIEEIPLVCSMLAARDVLEYHKGKKIMYSEGIPIVTEAFTKNGISIEKLASGGSVATSAFAFCYMIGIDNIILVGQDLALTGNRTHADGTFQDKMDEIDTSKSLMVEGNYEERVPTRGDFKNYLDWYNWYIDGCKKHGDLRVINATEGGAKIQNTEIMTLKEAIAELCTQEADVKGIIRKITPVFNEEQRKNVVGYLNEMPYKLEELRIEAQKAEKLYDKLYMISQKNGTDDTAYQKTFEKLKKVQKKIEGNLMYVTVRIALVNAENLMTVGQFDSEDTVQAEIATVATNGKKYMQMVQTCAKLFKTLAEETVGCVK